jgi:5-methylthioadenosine/S-adenosylhomocysteine deaminase
VVTIDNGTIVTMDRQRRVLAPGRVVVGSDRIVAVEPAERTDAQDTGGGAVATADEMIDLGGAIVLPGFVNTHHHLAATIQRGLVDSAALSVDGRAGAARVALHRHQGERECYAGALLAAVELLRSGVTTTTDSQAPWRGLGKLDGSLRAAHESGLRVVFSPAFVDRTEIVPTEYQFGVDEATAELERVRGRWSFDRVKVIPEALSLPRASDELIRRLHRAGEGEMAMHLSYSAEFAGWAHSHLGRSTIAHLDHLGVLGPGFLGAHPVFLDDDEVLTYAAAGAAAAYCAVSNMFIGTAHADLGRLRRAGVRVGLGLDYPNHGHNFFETMKTSLLAQKQLLGDADAWRPLDMLELATIGGAEALGMAGEVGSIEAGKAADLIVLDPHAIELTPPLGAVSLVVLAGTPAVVRDVMIGGRWLVRDHRLVHLDAPTVMAGAAQAQRELAAAAGIDPSSGDYGQADPERADEGTEVHPRLIGDPELDDGDAVR